MIRLINNLNSEYTLSDLKKEVRKIVEFSGDNINERKKLIYEFKTKIDKLIN